MKEPNKFSSEVRERAVRMVQAYGGEHPSRQAVVESIANAVGVVMGYSRQAAWQ